MSKINRRFPIKNVSMLPEFFQFDYGYFLRNLKFNKGLVVLSVKEWFKGFLRGGPKEFGEVIYSTSNGLLDYEKNKRGDYAFWFKNEDGDWERAGLPGMIEFLSQGVESLVASKSSRPEIFQDKHLISKLPNHHGFQLVKYVLDMV